jgi:outer membrane protein assembly factor BamB
MRDDCETDPFPEWLGGDVSRVTIAGDRVAVADAASLRVLESDGTLRWEASRTASAVGEVLGTKDVVVATDGSGAVAWDAVNGDQIWRTSDQPVLAAEEMIITCAEDEVRGLEPSSGSARWKIAASCGPTALHGSTAVMIANDPEVDGGQELIVFDVLDGRIVTRRAFEDGVDDQVGAFSGVLATKDRFLVAGTQADVVVIDATGIEQARLSSVEGHPAGVVDGVVVLTTHDLVAGVDGHDRSELWSLPTNPSATWAVTPAAVLRLDGPTGELSRIDARIGQVLWSTQVGSSATLAATATGSGPLYVRTLLAELLIDLESGAIISWSSTPPAVDEERRAG